MAEFSAHEKKLMARIPDESPLRTSLAQIREAVEKIWSPEARVIQDYTDHGIDHCVRLVGFANQLLKAHKGGKLTPEETFLLVAGIFLHDIGMQCDVVRFPEIKNRAEELGAKFDLDFTAKTSNSYSVEEQKAIRQNHHYLSIAWIDVARQSRESVLNAAAKSIPANLLLDLKDVCVHHTKRPISECPLHSIQTAESNSWRRCCGSPTNWISKVPALRSIPSRPLH